MNFSLKMTGGVQERSEEEVTQGERSLKFKGTSWVSKDTELFPSSVSFSLSLSQLRSLTSLLLNHFLY